jgi:hypothetical protein
MIRVRRVVVQLIETVFNEIASPLCDYFVQIDLGGMCSEIVDYVVLIDRLLVRPELLQYLSDLIVVPEPVTVEQLPNAHTVASGDRTVRRTR